MTRRVFSREFKQEAVELVKQRGVSAARRARLLARPPARVPRSVIVAAPSAGGISQRQGI